jgi:cell division protein FtsI (penicillin-binding protein 3)
MVKGKANNSKKKRQDRQQRNFIFTHRFDSNSIRQKKKEAETFSYLRLRSVTVSIFFVACYSFLIFHLIAFSFNFDYTKETESKKNTISFLERRADIVDRNGILIATNIPSRSLSINTTEVLNKEKTIETLLEVFPDLDEKKLNNEFNKGNRRLHIKRNIHPTRQERILKSEIIGLIWEDTSARVYPHNSLFSHVIGGVDNWNQGISGMEKQFNQLLNKMSNKEQKLELSLDIRVQHAVKDELRKGISRYKASAAAGIVMDIANGEVLSFVSLPDYNLNIPIDGQKPESLNRVTNSRYELGSILKIFTFAIALDMGSIKINEILEVPKTTKIGKYPVKDDHPKCNPKCRAYEIFIESSNVGAVEIIRRVGRKKQHEYFSKFGLLNRLSIELPEVAIPDQPKRWTKTDSESISFGYGLGISPLQLATGVASIVNEGYQIQPTLIKQEFLLAKNNKSDLDRTVSVDTSNKIRGLMRLAVAEGTGKNADVLGYEVGGKTGTARIYEKGIGYTTKSKRTTFLGIFPSSQPKYLTLVLLERPQPLAEDHFFNYAAYNSAKITAKIIERIGPILAINFPQNPSMNNLNVLSPVVFKR